MLFLYQTKFRKRKCFNDLLFGRSLPDGMYFLSLYRKLGSNEHMLVKTMVKNLFIISIIFKSINRLPIKVKMFFYV